jgi:hypothetical protein
MKIPRLGLAFFAVYASLIPVAWVSGCGGTGDTGGSAGSQSSQSNGTSSMFNGSGAGGVSGSNGSNGSGVGGSFAGSNGSGTPCTGLGCQVHSCSGGGSTTVSGTVYDPAGKNPLYGVVVYVPNAPVKPFTPGAGCYSCSDLYSGDPIAAAVTDANGNFSIQNAPDGANIPLVIQVGKWRRQFTLPGVTMCTDTPVPDLTLTLPKNASEGDLPNIAISTGSADSLECLLTRVGVDPAEYTPGAGGAGHIHIFHGNAGAPDTTPAAPTSSASLWDTSNDLQQYDIVLLSCEGNETTGMNQQALFDYAALGGRIFASHFHYAWFNTGPFGSHNLATWATGSNDLGNINASVVTTLWDSTPFIRGQALHDWLANPKVNALTNDLLPINSARHNADVSVANTVSQPWLVVSNATQQAQDFTFDTPFDVDAGSQCGRVAYSDMHVGAASGDYAGGKVTPSGCATGNLSPQEKALEFIFFDLSSCVTPNNMPQDPPGTIH